jgi:hypothetical protein
MSQPMDTSEHGQSTPPDVLQQLNDLQARIQELQDRNARVEAAYQELRHPPAGLNFPDPGAAFRDSSTFLGKHLAKPPEFDGKDRQGCSPFISHCRLYIRGNIANFPTEQSKILFVSSYLRGNAFSWFEPHLKTVDDPLFSNFETFVAELEKNMGDPDRERSLTRQLQTLSQTTSASAYATKFFQISSSLSWNDDALRAQFYTGLKKEVKDALAIAMITFEPTSVQALSDMAIRVDNRLYERKSEDRRGQGKEQARQEGPRVAPVNSQGHVGPRPMDLDANQKSVKFKPLTQEEKKRRRDNGLCLYCGEKGHDAANCPRKSRITGRTANATAYTISSPDSLESGNA